MLGALHNVEKYSEKSCEPDVSIILNIYGNNFLDFNFSKVALNQQRKNWEENVCLRFCKVLKLTSGPLCKICLLFQYSL